MESLFQRLVWLSAGEEFIAARIRRKVQLKISILCLVSPTGVNSSPVLLPSSFQTDIGAFLKAFGIFLFFLFCIFYFFTFIFLQIHHICAVEFSGGGWRGAWIIDALIFCSLFMDCNHLQQPFKHDLSKCCVIFAVIIQSRLDEYLSFIINVYLFVSLRANLGWSTRNGFVKHDFGRRSFAKKFQIVNKRNDEKLPELIKESRGMMDRAVKEVVSLPCLQVDAGVPWMSGCEDHYALFLFSFFHRFIQSIYQPCLMIA